MEDLLIALFTGAANGFLPASVLIAVAIYLYKRVDKMAEQVDILYNLHDVKDSDGVPVWYVRHSLEKSIEKLATAVEQMSNNSVVQTKILEAMSHELSRHATESRK